MELYKIISKLLNDSTVSKFVTKKWIKVMIYQVVNILETRILKKIENFKTSLIKSDLCEYSDAYIVAKRQYLLQVLIMLTEAIKS